VEALETYSDVSIRLFPEQQGSGPLYWEVNPLERRLVQYWFSLPKQPHPRSPLGSDVHNQDDLSLELLKIVLLVAGEFGLEVVKLGHYA